MERGTRDQGDVLYTDEGSGSLSPGFGAEPPAPVAFELQVGAPTLQWVDRMHEDAHSSRSIPETELLSTCTNRNNSIDNNTFLEPREAYIGGSAFTDVQKREMIAMMNKAFTETRKRSNSRASAGSRTTTGSQLERKYECIPATGTKDIVTAGFTNPGDRCAFIAALKAFQETYPLEYNTKIIPNHPNPLQDLRTDGFASKDANAIYHGLVRKFCVEEMQNTIEMAMCGCGTMHQTSVMDALTKLVITERFLDRDTAITIQDLVSLSSAPVPWGKCTTCNHLRTNLRFPVGHPDSRSIGFTLSRTKIMNDGSSKPREPLKLHYDGGLVRYAGGTYSVTAMIRHIPPVVDDQGNETSPGHFTCIVPRGRIFREVDGDAAPAILKRQEKMKAMSQVVSVMLTKVKVVKRAPSSEKVKHPAVGRSHNAVAWYGALVAHRRHHDAEWTHDTVAAMSTAPWKYNVMKEQQGTRRPSTTHTTGAVGEPAGHHTTSSTSD